MAAPRLFVSDAPARPAPAGVAPPGIEFAGLVMLLGGAVLLLAGAVDVALFYWPLRFGEAEWEFSVIAQTFDALPLPTVGVLLVALGIHARSGRRLWPRLLAALLLAVAAVLLALLVIFALDIPVALKAMERATEMAQQRGVVANPLVAAGLRRAMAKASLLGTAYVSLYAVLALVMWRSARTAP